MKNLLITLLLTSLLGIQPLPAQTISSPHQPKSAELTAIAALTTTSYGRSVLTLADAAAARTLIQLGNVENTALSTWTGSTNVTTLGTIAAGTWQGTVVGVSYGGTGASTAATARSNLGLAIGTNVQAYDATLAALAGLADGSGVLTNNGSGTLSYTGTTVIGQLDAVVDGQIPVFSNSGTLSVGQLSAVSAGYVNPSVGVTPLAVIFNQANFSAAIVAATLTAGRTITVPDAAGTIITTGNLTSITSTGTITSGTWQGTDVGLAYVAQGGATDGQVLRWSSAGSSWVAASPDPTPVALTYNATLSPAYGDGSLRTCTLTGDTTLNVPSGASAGQTWRGVFTASGAARDITLASGFKILTGATYTAEVASGSIRFIEAYYTGAVWLVIKNQEFVP